MPTPKGPTWQRNPYLNRVMIREVSDFYGRRREVAKIFARIGAPRPQSVAIVGERRIGKSSLLNYLCHAEIRRHHLENPEAYTFVLIDLQEQREIGIRAFFENLFGGIEQALGRTRPPDLPADYEGARRALLRLQEEGRKIILLFDEFDAITRNPNFPEEFFAFLRAVANKYDVAYVTTSGRDLQQLCHADRIADSPFFNIFSNLFLTRFEPEEALALIRQPSEAAGVPLAPYATDIVDLGGLFPFFLQMACAAFFEHLAEKTHLDIGRVRASFQEEAEPHFAYIREHLDEDQRSVLRDLAEGRSVPPSRSYLLAKLRRDGYLLEQDGRERLFSSVFAACLQEGRPTHDPSPSAPASDPERWQQISKLYHAALGREGNERAAFLAEVCVGDAPLRREVELLLAWEGDARRFIEAPALETATHVLAEKRDASLVGQQIGVYQILSRLGAGGMGVVYRAYDPRLERPVAIKLLPAASFTDPIARTRLLREARTASKLNHPHICTIHEVGEADGHAYIAMELVEGESLSARLESGPLPPEHVLRYGLQLADALAHAHERGVVHHDLKSANVIITPEGRAKVLDFGLAKQLSGNELTEATTQSQASLTQPGAVMGTLAYMAPEQLRGQSADARSDVWALGVVLYEMAAGVRPFQGHTGFELSSAVLSQTPAPLPANVPAAMRAVVERCLEKEPGRRYQRAGEAHAAVEAIQSSGVAPGRGWRYRWLAGRPWLALVTVALVLMLVALVMWTVGRIGNRQLGRATVPRIASLAVLPLENLSGDAEQEYFAGRHDGDAHHKSGAIQHSRYLAHVRPAVQVEQSTAA